MPSFPHPAYMGFQRMSRNGHKAPGGSHRDFEEASVLAARRRCAAPRVFRIQYNKRTEKPRRSAADTGSFEFHRYKDMTSHSGFGGYMVPFYKMRRIMVQENIARRQS